MRTVPVIVPGVPGQHFAEMPLTKDQDVIEALAAKRAHEPLRECVGPHRQQHLIQMIGTDVCG